MRSEEEGRERVDNSENVRRTEWMPWLLRVLEHAISV